MLSFLHTVLSIATGLLIAIVIWFRLRQLNKHHDNRIGH